MEYIAHINNKTKKIQTVEEHSINTAELSSSYAIDSLKDICYVLGLYHDIGKYQNAFQERIKGRDIKVEHSLCGAIEVREAFRKKNRTFTRSSFFFNTTLYFRTSFRLT
jgi:CRISPR-associated endonuclease/helicase Cas3